jgi:hypothetical protein
MNNNIERLHLYIDGQLSPSEMEDFERQLADDEILRANYENLKIMQNALKSLSDQDLPQGLHEKMLHKARLARRKRTINRIVRPFGAVAAAVLAVLVIFTFDGRRMSPPDMAEFEPMAAADAPMGAGDFTMDAPERESLWQQRYYGDVDADMALEAEISADEMAAGAPAEIAEVRALIAPPIQPPGFMHQGHPPTLNQILAYLAALSVEIEDIIHDHDGIRIIIFVESEN